MSSAICFNLDQSEILLSCNGLKLKIHEKHFTIAHVDVIWVHHENGTNVRFAKTQIKVDNTKGRVNKFAIVI